MKILTMVVGILGFIVILWIAASAVQVGTINRNKCEAAGGIYLGREMKCIKAMEIKV